MDTNAENNPEIRDTQLASLSLDRFRVFDGVCVPCPTPRTPIWRDTRP